MGNTYSVYHACRKKDVGDYQKGYIGVSGNVEQRIRAHKTPSGTRGRVFTEAKAKFSDIIYYIIFSGSEKDCYDLEKELRPGINIGWNMFAGGKEKAKGYNTTWCKEAKESVSGENSHLRKGTYHTPEGKFTTCVAVANHYGISKSTVQYRCKSCKAIGRSRHHPNEIWGRTWRELGWYFIEEKQDDCVN